MSLKFRECTECGESHAVRVNGAMSIHTTAAGERCEEPSEAPPVRPRVQRPRLIAVPKPSPHADSEMQAAFGAARKGRRGWSADDRAKNAAPDRRIYVTKGMYVIGGGLPTLGKGR